MEKRIFVNSFEKNFIFPAYVSGIIGFTEIVGEPLSWYLRWFWIIAIAIAAITKFLKLNLSWRFEIVLKALMNLIIIGVLTLVLPDWMYPNVIKAVLTTLALKRITSDAYFFVSDPSGPYGVGIKDVIIKGKTTPMCSIVYPIEKEEYLNNVESFSRTLIYNMDGEDEIKCLLKLVPLAKQVYKSDALDKMPTNATFLDLAFRDSYLYRIRAIVDGNLHKDFKSGVKKLTPVIISHGYAGRRAQHLVLASFLASYGWIVYTLNHTGGSATVSRDYNQDPLKVQYPIIYDFDTKQDANGNKYEQEEFDLKVVKDRIVDFEVLLDYIKNESMREFEHIDASKLAAFGHSLGGMTILEFSKLYKKDVKACICFDPYLSARHKDINKGEEYFITQPLLFMNTVLFNDAPILNWYDHTKTRDKLFEDTMKKNGNQGYNIMVENSGHSSQSDDAMLKPVLRSKMNAAGTGEAVGEKYLEFINTSLAFLEKNKLLPVEFPKGLSPHIS